MLSLMRHTGSVFIKSRPIHLTFFLTARCNARCPFCFYLKSSNHQASGSGELTLDEIKKISGSMGNLLWLAFSGGEIYLRNDLAEIARTFHRNNKPSIMLFPTNGLLPDVIRATTEEILRDCPESIIAVKLSLDGVGQRHDQVRDTPGSFERTMQTYDVLRPFLGRFANFELGVNTVFCSENQNEIDEIIDFVKGLEHVRTHTISMVRGNLADEGFKKIDHAKYFSAIMRLEQNLKDRSSQTYRFRGARIKAAQDILQRQLIYRTVQEKKRLIPCYAGRLNMVITERGEVFPCEILAGSFGNIRDYDYDMNKIVRSDTACKVIASIKNNECYCTHECYFMTNILFNPRLYPDLAREYFQL